MSGAELAAWIVLAAAALLVSGVRWLRVGQREQYIAGRVSRTAALWARRRPVDALVAVLAVLAAALALATGVRAAIVLALAAAGAFPLGLSLRGRTSPLRWTARMRRLAAVWAVLSLGATVLVVLLAGARFAVLPPLLGPAWVDLALAVVGPVEARAARVYVDRARERLRRVRPTVVAITGSYGKTSTKGYVAHVVAGSRTVVASPASFNNVLGLSRAVNDRVVPGTEVFVAEMGTYGPGEIRQLCEYFPPDVAAITSIGEAHLERMGSRAAIVRAKSEITERARVCVLPVDVPELAELAQVCRERGQRVVTCSTRADVPADVFLEPGSPAAVVRTADGGERRLPVAVPEAGHAVNVAVCLGIALALDLDLDAVAPRLADLPGAQHRAEIQHTPDGLVVIDDTYNANPVGALTALRGAARLTAERGGALVVVTPGMVELGSMQRRRNTELGRAVAQAGGTLVVVGRTNRTALLAGAAEGRGQVRTFDRRADAVRCAVGLAGTTGVILYENDLPDHYP